MKVRLTLDVGDFERYIIAKYFSRAPEQANDKRRLRARLKQVVRFAQASLRAAVKEQAANLRARERATAQRLASPVSEEPALVRPSEQQPELAW